MQVRFAVTIFFRRPISIVLTLLRQVAKKLKKMQVNVDVVNFGETSSNTSKVLLISRTHFLWCGSHTMFLSAQHNPLLQLDRFIETVNNNGNSHLITVPPGTMLHLADIVMESPICMYALFQPQFFGAAVFTSPPLDVSHHSSSLRLLTRSGFGAVAGSGSGSAHAPASTISNQYESDIQRAIQVFARFLALRLHADQNLCCVLLYFM